MAVCLNCGASLDCNCQVRVAKDQKSCCARCVDQYNMSIESGGGEQSVIAAPSYLVPVIDNLKITSMGLRTVNTPVITSVRYMNFDK